MPRWSMRYRSTPGSSEPLRVPMGRPSTAVKPIVLVMLRPDSIAHMLAPLPRCSTTVRPAAAFASNFRQHRGDVLVRQAMKSVSSHAGGVQLLGQGESLRHLRICAVERGVEAGDLRQLGRALEQPTNGSEIVRLMERRQRDQLFKRRRHAGIDEHWLREVQPAMHDAMPDADERRIRQARRAKT